MDKPRWQSLRQIFLQWLGLGLIGSVFFLAFMPVFGDWIDARRFEADQVYADELNAALARSLLRRAGLSTYTD
ncbi:MAG: hypothetical protein EA374_08575 [Acholeplasmatales bacterium]|nr:MAG: hypothetical protein EA374_08575 [Acholeplasmatales bacterium]